MSEELRLACLAKLNEVMLPVFEELGALRAERDALVESIRPQQAKIRELGDRIKAISPTAAEYQQMAVELHKKHKKIGNIPTQVELIAKQLGVE